MPSQGHSARISVATVERIEWLQLAVFGCLLLLLSLDIHPVSAYTLEDDYIRLPTEFAAKVPARLVFTPQELAACWIDTTATRCVLKGGERQLAAVAVASLPECMHCRTLLPKSRLLLTYEWLRRFYQFGSECLAAGLSGHRRHCRVEHRGAATHHHIG